MGIYLVMKNNLKRSFQAKITYLTMFLIPILICLSGIVANGFTGNSIRVGVVLDGMDVNNTSLEEFKNQVKDYKDIQYEIANPKSIHTDVITKKYQYVLNLSNGSDWKSVLNEILFLAKSEINSSSKELTSTGRIIAILMTAYMIIATIYATRIIKDKQGGMLARFQCTGHQRRTYMLGYMLSTFIIVFLQIAVGFLVTNLLGTGFSIPFYKTILLILFISLVATLFGVVVSLVNKNELNANIMASSITVVCSLIGGTFLSVSQMPMFLQVVSVLSPIRWVLDFLM